MKIIGVATSKGGVGKTTTVIQVGANLALRGYKVCLLDVDSQGNLSDQFGVTSEKSLAIFLREPRKGVDILTVRDNLDLIPSGKAELYKTMKFMIMEPSPLKVMANAFDFLDQSLYQYLLIDTSPTMTLMNDNALFFCDSVLIPFSIGYFDIAGADQLLANIELINKTERKHAPIKIQGVFINMFDERTKISQAFIKMLKEKFKDKLFETKVHKSVQISEAPLEQKTIFEYAPKSRAAQEWENLTMELLNRA